MVSATTMKTVARIQYTAQAYKHNRTAAEPHGRRGVFLDEHLQEHVMGTTPRNEGEGNKTADRNYREATKKFVESERGRAEIDKAGQVSPREEEEIERAEEEAKGHAKK